MDIPGMAHYQDATLSVPGTRIRGDPYGRNGGLRRRGVPIPFLPSRTHDLLFTSLRLAVFRITPTSATPVAHILRDCSTDPEVYKLLQDLYVYDRDVGKAPSTVVDASRQTQADRDKRYNGLRAQIANAYTKHADLLREQKMYDVDVIFKCDQYQIEPFRSEKLRLEAAGGQSYHIYPFREKEREMALSIIVPQDVLDTLYTDDVCKRLNIVIKTNTAPSRPADSNPRRDLGPGTIFPFKRPTTSTTSPGKMMRDVEEVHPARSRGESVSKVMPAAETDSSALVVMGLRPPPPEVVLPYALKSPDITVTNVEASAVAPMAAISTCSFGTAQNKTGTQECELKTYEEAYARYKELVRQAEKFYECLLNLRQEVKQAPHAQRSALRLREFESNRLKLLHDLRTNKKEMLQCAKICNRMPNQAYLAKGDDWETRLQSDPNKQRQNSQAVRTSLRQAAVENARAGNTPLPEPLDEAGTGWQGDRVPARRHAQCAPVQNISYSLARGNTTPAIDGAHQISEIPPTDVQPFPPYRDPMDEAIGRCTDNECNINIGSMASRLPIKERAESMSSGSTITDSSLSSHY